MKMRSCALLSQLACLLLLQVSLASAGQAVYGTDVNIETSGTGVYKVKAKVTDLSDQAVLSAAVLRVAVDEPATSETVLPDGETRVLLKVKLDSAARRATYAIEVRKAGMLLASSSASLPLP